MVERLVPEALANLFGAELGLDAGMALVGCGTYVLVYACDDAATPDDPLDDEWIHLEDIAVLPPPGFTNTRSIAIQGDVALVGQTQAIASGRVCVFQRSDAGTPDDALDDAWTETTILVPEDGTAGDYFGRSLSLDGNRALVGASRDADLVARGGSAYLFERQDNGTPLDPLDDSWIQLEKYRPVDLEPDALFGASVALAGDEVLVGSNEDAYAYRVGEVCTAFVGPRPGAGVNVECLTSTTLPELGGEWRLEIENSGHPAPIYSLLIGTDKPLGPGVLGSMGELLVDIIGGNILLATQLFADPGGLDVFAYAVPPDPVLIGLQMFLQGGVLGGGQGYFTNALNAVVGVAAGD